MTPLFKERKVNRAEQSIEAFLHYPDHQFDFSIKVFKNATGVRLTVNLSKPLPPSLERKAGFNLEFLPSAYFHKSAALAAAIRALKGFNDALAQECLARQKKCGKKNFLYGTHPAHNLSLVSNVGTRTKEVAYGMNRADFSFISGGIVPGVLILKPDYPENHEDRPFFLGAKRIRR